MILFTTVMMISLIAIMVLALMKSLIGMRQINAAITTVHQDLFHLEAVAQVIVAGVDIQHLCQAVCHIDYQKARYDYSVQDAGEFACLVLQVGAQYYASHHAELEVYAADNPSRRLHVHFVVLAGVSDCAAERHELPAKGILTWRYMRTADA